MNDKIEVADHAKLCALLVGVEHVNYGKYNVLRGCVNDVDKIECIINGLNEDFIDNVEIKILLNENATKSNILKYISDKSKTLKTNDLFIFYFSGHGSQIQDVNGDEDDNMDETLVVYDKYIIDDELWDEWKKFSIGVRILMVSDACNSGTNFKALRKKPQLPLSFFEQSRKFDKDDLNAELIHIGGSRDSEQAEGTPSGGVLTDEIYKIYRRSNFKKSDYNFNLLKIELQEKIGKEQEIVFNYAGNKMSNGYLDSVPFKLLK
jgi:hypothetical protein